MSDEKRLKEVIKKIKDATDYRKQQRDKEYVTNMANYEGLGWELASYNSESPFIIKSDINHLKNAIDIRLGSLFANTYYGELKPQSPSDVEAVQALNVLYKNEWYRLNADDMIEKVVKDGAICDNGYVEVNFDTDAMHGGKGTRREGLITINHLHSANVYLDPNAASIDDCDYIVTKVTKTKSWLKRHHKDWLDKLKDENISPGSYTNNDAGDIYVGRDYDTKSSSLYLIETLYEKYVEEVDMEVQDDEGKAILDEKEKPLVEKVKRTRIKLTYVINNKIMEENKDYPFDEFNIIPFQWQDQPQSPYGIPLMRGLTVPQRVANLIESAANNIAMHYTVPTYMVSDESGLDIDEVAKLGPAPGMVWLVNGDPRGAIAQLDPPKINSDLMAIRNDFVNNIREYAGATGVYQGDIGTAGSTAEGTLAAIGRATIIDNAPLKQIQNFVERLSRMIIRFMTRYYKNQNVYVREQDKMDPNKYQFLEYLVKEEYNFVDYDFTVDLASRSKTDKNRQYNLMKEIYQLQNQYKDPTKVVNVTDVVKAAQLDNYNEMFKRYRDMSEEAFEEKAELIVQIMSMAQTMTPNGQPLIPAEQIQAGIIDVLNDDNELTTVENIFRTYEEYQTAVTEFNNQQAQQQYADGIANLQQSLIPMDQMSTQNTNNGV